MVADAVTADATQAAFVVPVGARVVHIGPPKTGTTALQAALFAARDSLVDQGVRYPGEQRHSADAIRSVMNRPSFRHNGQVPQIEAWERLLGEIRAAAEPRVMISSEYLAGSDPETVRRIAADLDPGRVHVVATLRPLASLLPSQWQQDVRRGTRDAFDPWLREILEPRPGRTALFWRTHRNDRIVRDWSDAVGADHVTVVALGDADRDFLFRAFEGLLGLRDGTLVAQPDVVNRSLTLPEAEAVRALNLLFSEAGIDWTTHTRLVHMGAAKALWGRTPGPEEPRIEPPQWALDRAVELDREMVDAIRGLGVHVMGDLEGLVQPHTSRDARGDAEVTVSPAVAATMAMGIVKAAGFVQPAGGDGARLGPFAGLSWYTSREILKASAILVGRRSARRLRGMRRPPSRGARTGG